MKKVIITGGAGFIGSHLAQHLAQKYRVTVLDDLSTGSLSNLEGVDCKFVPGSILDVPLLDDLLHGAEFVFHLAAMVSVAESMTNSRECVNQNVTGLLNVLDACVQHQVKKIVFASSAAVYGNSPQSPKRESNLPAPESPYAITKLDGEFYLEMYRKVHGLESAAPRFFNVYGPRQNPDGAYAAAVPIFVSQALGGEKITVFGDGDQTRDFISVLDIVSGIEKAAEIPTIIGPFNLACGEATSLNELLSVIFELTGSSSEVVYEAPRPGDIRHSLADISRAINLGINPQNRLRETLREMITSSTH